MAEPVQIPVCLTIAGSDSSGGAGIQADLRTFAYFSVYATSAITAITAQTPADVLHVMAVPQETVAAQLDAALKSAQIDCIKIGMVHSVDTLGTIARALQGFHGQVVMDPVLAAGCGGQLNQTLPPEAILSFAKAHTTFLTPNIPEAEYLLGRPIDTSLSALETAALELSKHLEAGIYLKGGHAHTHEQRGVDILATADGLYQLTAPVLAPAASHGTGCTLSSALAARLAFGSRPVDAAITAKAFVWQSMERCIQLNRQFSAMFPPGDLDTSMISAALTLGEA